MAGANNHNVKAGLSVAGKTVAIGDVKAMRESMSKSQFAVVSAAASSANASTGATGTAGRSAAIDRMRAAAKLVNSGSPADVARGERSMAAAIRQLRASRNPSALGSVTKKTTVAAGAATGQKSAPKVAAKSPTSAAKPVAKPAGKPVGKHGDIHVYADKGGSFRLVHAATGHELGGGFSKGAAKSLARHFGLGRVKGVGGTNPANATFKKAMSGDAKATKAVHEWLAEGRRRSAPKLAVVH